MVCIREGVKRDLELLGRLDRAVMEWEIGFGAFFRLLYFLVLAVRIAYILMKSRAEFIQLINYTIDLTYTVLCEKI